jgi:GNAT superfamily N-acetyltransferase
VTPEFEFAGVAARDFEELLALRLATMRESLERIGRFDPARAAERFRTTFRPADTRPIVVAGEPAGCVGFWAEPVDAMRIEQFYLDARFQRRGLGGVVLERLLNEAPARVRIFRVGALRDSDALRFYRRHGFVKISESEWDIEHERLRPPASG